MMHESGRPSLLTNRRALLATIAGCALLLGLFLSMQAYVEVHRVGRAVSFGRMFLNVMPIWLLWAIASPVVLASVGTDDSVDHRHSSPRISRPVGVVIAAMLLHSAALYAWQRALWLTDLQIPIWKGAIAVAWWRLPTNLLVCGALLGIALLSNSARRTAGALRYAHERELLASRLTEQLATARLTALREQLNPHFLFNALNTVAMLARRGESASVVEMVSELGKLLRHVLNDAAAAEVSLGEELDFIRRYLAIEQMRFGDRLNVAFDIPNESLDARVPSLILQPIVENAVRHGAAEAAGVGFVRITASRCGDNLVLHVVDNGPGVRDTHDANAGPGLGIRNTVERLAHLYGDDFEFELRSQLDGTGTVATIVFPFVSQSADALA